MELLWSKDMKPHTYQLVDKPSIIIGRRQDCDIVLKDKTVSRRHAEIFIEHDRYHLHNLSQTNTILVYTKQKLEHKQSSVLKRGDSIQLGTRQIRLLSVQKFTEGLMLELGTLRKTYFISNKQPITLGRDETCDIVIDNWTVSRRHAEIFSKNGYIYIRNLSQSNCISLHIGQRLQQGGVILIKSGDAFKLGPTHICTQSILGLTNDISQTLARLYKVKCHSCHQNVKSTLKDCPWCGAVLACGVTI